MTANTLIIRADASSEMGTGHVMRCLALAEPWLTAGSKVILAAQQLPESLAEKAKAMGVALQSIQADAGSSEDANATAALVQAHAGAWLVVDGYQFDTAYQQALKAAGARVLLVDDFGHAKHYCADYVLNQNLGATPDWYPRHDEKTRLLLGTRYVQLRGEFLKQAVPPWTPRAGIMRVLVTLGGSDPDNVTEKVIVALSQMIVDATVVVGGSNPHWESLQATIPQQDQPFRLIRNAANMPELMAQTDIAVAAGGTTAWELAYMGVPMLTIVLADNQKSNAEQLAATGVAENLGWHADLTPDHIAERILLTGLPECVSGKMSAIARKLVDGLGSMRVWLRLNADRLDLRTITSTDAGLCPPYCRIWVATDAEGTPLGKIQFAIRGPVASVSFNLDTIQWGENQGALLIWAACRKLFAETDITEIHADIKQDEKDVVQAYENAGFALCHETTKKKPQNARYILHRQELEDQPTY